MLSIPRVFITFLEGNIAPEDVDLRIRAFSASLRQMKQFGTLGGWWHALSEQ